MKSTKIVFTGCLHAIVKATLHLLDKNFSLQQCLPPGDPRNPCAGRVKERVQIATHSLFCAVSCALKGKRRKEFSLFNLVFVSTCRVRPDAPRLERLLDVEETNGNKEESSSSDGEEDDKPAGKRKRLVLQRGQRRPNNNLERGK